MSWLLLDACVESEKLKIADSEIWHLSHFLQTSSSLLRLAENNEGKKRMLKTVNNISGKGERDAREVDVYCQLNEVRKISTHLLSSL